MFSKPTIMPSIGGIQTSLIFNKSPYESITRARFMPRFFASQPSVIEEVFGKPSSTSPINVLNAKSKSPVHLNDGDIFLYEASSSSKINIFIGALPFVVIAIYLMVNGRDLFAPEGAVTMAKPSMLIALGLFGVGTVVLYRGIVHATIKYAVLERDGLFLRLYPHGMMLGFNTGRPIRVPIKHLSEFTPKVQDKSSSGRGNDSASTLKVFLNKSSTNVVFDKPETILKYLNGSKGSGLVLDAAGCQGVIRRQPPPVVSALEKPLGESVSQEYSSLDIPIITPVNQLYAMTEDERKMLRLYALLVFACNGHVINMARVWTDEWELEKMVTQLAKDPKAFETKVSELRYWTEAIDPVTNKPFWWHELTRVVQWETPMLEGKDPYQWHPDLKASQMRL
jgi:hypothetical protein